MNGMSRAKKAKSRGKTQKEAVQVFCRIRPLVSPSEPVCLRVIPPCHVLMTPGSALRNGSDIRFTFKNVFDDSVSQKTIFDSIALPSIENVLLGRNALLFAYGVTGSGKTYTMTGSPQNVGVIPRSLDVIFNSIVNSQAKKYIFKPDRLNGFDIQSEHDAEIDRNQEFLLKMSNKNGKSEKKMINADMAARMRESTIVQGIDEDNLYSVFITYVEIYNNTVYDLLEDVDDEALHVKPLQPRLIREDSNRHMFVHGVNEVEVTTADEAFELYLKGKKRRRIGHTNLNSESSRSHSIFTIRIVQAPLNPYGSGVSDNKSYLITSQLSLVDLAGSERTHRTKNTGQRLREACNINNSLLTLRTCLELLRENQNGAKKMIPYRDSRLTHLFKTFLDGDGQISMIICVGPHIDDYDEILHVMKFAEISQEVQVAVSTPVKMTNYTPGRRKAYQMAKELENDKNIANAPIQDKENYSSYWFNNLPDARFIDDETLPKLIKCLEDGLIAVSNLGKEIIDGCLEGKKRLLTAQREIGSSMEELNVLRNRFQQEKEKVVSLENKALNNDSQMLKMKRKIDDYEVNVKKLKRELTEKELVISETRLEQEKAKKAFAQKMMMAQEKLNRDLEKKLRTQKSALQYEMRHKESKLNAVKKIIASDDMLDSSGQFLRPMPLVPSTSQESIPKSPWGTPRSQKVPTTPSTPNTQGTPRGRPTARKMGVAVANRRFRRSKSAGDELWLEHRAGVHAPSNTIMQPTMTKRKSITKLTDAKDVTENASKYCLMTQGQDSDGDIETRLYKGDIIPTAGGGAQVMFNDVEVLRQMSPTRSPPCKTPGEIRQHFEAACASAKKVCFKSPRI